MNLGLAGASVVIAGGGSNIGRAITLGFAAENANVTIADIDGDQAEKVAAEAAQLGAAGTNVARADASDLEQVRRAFEGAKAKFGSIDVLVNCVGWDKLMFFVDTTPEFWAKVIQLNYLTTLSCTKAALEIMIPQGSGSIVSISSDASRQGEPREAVYGGLKAATNSLMKTVARENGRFGIRCNAVCPGLTTPEDNAAVGEQSMWFGNNSFNDDHKEAVAKKLPLKRLGVPNDIANAVLFLSSNAAAGYITGQVLSVSGGYSMIG